MRPKRSLGAEEDSLYCLPSNNIGSLDLSCSVATRLLKPRLTTPLLTSAEQQRPTRPARAKACLFTVRSRSSPSSPVKQFMKSSRSTPARATITSASISGIGSSTTPSTPAHGPRSAETSSRAVVSLPCQQVPHVPSRINISASSPKLKTGSTSFPLGRVMTSTSNRPWSQLLVISQYGG